MLRIIKFIIIFIIFTNCSFDNKSGIWTENIKKKKISLKESKKYDSVFKNDNILSEEVFAKLNSSILLQDKTKNNNWEEEFYNFSNNIENIDFNSELILLHKKSFDDFFIKKNNKKKNLLIYNDHVISSDNSGNIYIYSLSLKKKIFKFNFYKKKYKGYKKEIYLLLNNEIIYASDNLGFIYAIDINKEKILWAKNYGIPFRSNIKIFNNQLILANQDNTIFSINIINGNKTWSFLTEATLLKSEFINNFAISKKDNALFFYNTSGALYSINLINKSINWVVNFNEFDPQKETNIFFGLPLSISKNNSIIVVGERSIVNVDTLTGSIIWKKKLKVKAKPVLTKNNIFLTTEDNYALCLNINNGEIVWSRNILSQVNVDKTKLSFYSNIDYNFIANNKFILIHNTGRLTTVNIDNGNVLFSDEITTSKVIGGPVFANKNMYLLDRGLKLYKYK